MKRKLLELWPVAAAVVASAALTTTMIGRTSTAMFDSSVQNQNNSWSTGTVTLAANGVASAVFDTATDGTLTGGQAVQKCIQLDYTGTLPATVKLYGSVSGTLGPYLDITVDRGTGSGANGACTGYSATTGTLYSGTLAGFAVAAPDYANGVGSWSTTNGTSTVYRITATVQNVVGAQGKSATANFTWEARG